MTTCCVPDCDSSLPYKKDNKRCKISFHQFPSNLELKKKWIIAIGKKDLETGNYWNPHSSAVVCSLHFSPKQFKNSKKAVLKCGSIPFIFFDHHLPEYGTLVNEADLSSCRTVIETVKKKRQKTISVLDITAKLPTTNIVKTVDKQSDCSNLNFQSHSEINKIQNLSASLQNSNSILHSILQSSSSTLIPEVSSNFDSAVDNSSSASDTFVHSFLESNSNLSENQNIHTIPKEDQVCFSRKLFLKDNSTQTTVIQNEKSNTSIAVLTLNSGKPIWKNVTGGDKFLLTQLDLEKQKNGELRAQLLKTEQENENLQLQNQIMNEKLELFNTEELKNGIANMDARALFLFEQLCSYAKKKIAWSESTVHIADCLEKNFPESYNFLWQTNVISLPSPKGMRNDHEYETDVCYTKAKLNKN